MQEDEQLFICPFYKSLQEDGTSEPPASLQTEMFVDSKHPNQVLEGLNRLRLQGVLCDVILCCEREEFPCHRYLLASFSSYFQVSCFCLCFDLNLKLKHHSM